MNRNYSLPRTRVEETQVPIEDHHRPGHYEIRIKGHLADRWSHWFEDLIITRESSGNTLLTGQLADQAALHGVLRKVRDLGMPLLSVNNTESKEIGQ